MCAVHGWSRQLLVPVGAGALEERQGTGEIRAWKRGPSYSESNQDRGQVSRACPWEVSLAAGPPCCHPGDTPSV